MKANIQRALREGTSIIRRAIKIRLTLHANMLPMLCLPRGMPHDGLIPTGADEAGTESPVSVLLGENRSIYNE